MLEREKGVFPLCGSLWYNGGKDDLMQRITGVKKRHGKEETIEERPQKSRLQATMELLLR